MNYEIENGEINYHQKTQYKTGLKELIVELQPTHFITINSNTDSISKELMQNSTDKTLMQSLSHTYRKNSIREYINYIFFLEKNEWGTVHSHILISLPDPNEERALHFLKIIERKAKTNIPKSSINFKTIHDMRGVIDYCTKDFTRKDNFYFYSINKKFIPRH